ncbi:hypothetical protein K435DRAFT_901013 [Dendrothele bispora CBS 962.96]|uniref:Uncharacterized protein n=1 Tax=Dendrothele bispora (strain CBS 962.96) TaxID=1314807 RepID=A0A4S8LWK3_DENBC|nr:hypothetical protein K435DRAFT_901013 [Dendrothele bispora CBS 962.96]
MLRSIDGVGGIPHVINVDTGTIKHAQLAAIEHGWALPRPGKCSVCVQRFA